MSLFLVVYTDYPFAERFSTSRARDARAHEILKLMREDESGIKRVETTNWQNLCWRVLPHVELTPIDLRLYREPLPNPCLDYELCLQLSRHSFGPGAYWVNVVCESHEKRMELAAGLRSRPRIRLETGEHLIYAIDLVDRMLVHDTRTCKLSGGERYDRRYRCKDVRIQASSLHLTV